MTKREESAIIVGVGMLGVAIIVLTVILASKSSGGDNVSLVADSSTNFARTPEQSTTPGDSQENMVNPEGLSFENPAAALFEAIRIVEGDDGKVGPAGERGPYRITKDYWFDAMEYGIIKGYCVWWKYETCVYIPAYCELAMTLYWKRYGAVTNEQKARMHNGGPRGMQKDATLEYWQKVQEAMK